MNMLFVSMNSDAILNCVFSLINSISENFNCDLLVYGCNEDRLSSNKNIKGHIYYLKKDAQPKFVKLFNYLFGNLYAGYFANRKLHKIEKKVNELNCINNYDCLVTCSGEYKIHQLKGDIPNHFIYLVDPFYFNMSFSRLTRMMRLHTELKCFKDAKAIFCPSIMKNEYANKKVFKCFSEKIISLEFPLIYGRKATVSSSNIGAFKKDESFFFFGSFYNGVRNPSYLISFFKGLNYKLYIVGNLSRFYKKQIEKIDNIVYLGHFPLDETLSIINESHFLINVGNSVSNQTPSKMFEYISFRRPIINFCKIENCSSKLLLENYPYPYLNIFEYDPDINGQKKRFIEFVEKNKTEYLSCDDNLYQAFVEYTPSFVAKKFEVSVNEKINQN